MAPNPIVIPRQHTSSTPRSQRGQHRSSRLIPVLCIVVAIIAAGAVSQEWGRSWVTSGTATASILLCLLSYQSPSVRVEDVWLSLAVLNVSFAISSTSWLLYPVFVAVIYTIEFWICITLFPVASSLCRRTLRLLFPRIYFLRDKIAFCNLPALQIDTEVNGLFVIRSLTLSLLDLSIEARGIELGLRFNQEVELSLCADRLTIRLFRNIHVSDVYGNLKVEESEMYFDSPEDSNTRSHEMSQQRSKGLLADLSGFSSAQPADGANSGQTRSSRYNNTVTGTGSQQHPSRLLNDAETESNHEDLLAEIEESSQIHIARSQIQSTESSKQPSNEREMRQAVCAKLQDVPSVSHTPKQAVRVSVLQTIFPRVRRFLHRLPLLIRLLLNPLSNFHPIDIASVSVAGPGEKLKAFLENYMSKIMAEEAQDADMEQFQNEMSEWLAGATFCLEAANIKALSHVPLNSNGEITTYMRTGNVSMYRTPLDSNIVTQVTHIGGTDGTVVMPAYLLPHHEHCLPSRPVEIEAERHDSFNSNQDEVQSDTKVEQAEMTVSVHASLPTHLDQSLLDFAAVLLKATKVIDLENLFERGSSSSDYSSEQYRSEDASTDVNAAGEDTSQNHEGKDTESGLSRRLASKAYHSLKDGVKKGTMINVATNKINDRWVMKTVSRIAARLEQAQGDFGYTTNIPIDLKPYRDAAETPSKILP